MGLFSIGARLFVDATGANKSMAAYRRSVQMAILQTVNMRKQAHAAGLSLNAVQRQMELNFKRAHTKSLWAQHLDSISKASYAATNAVRTTLKVWEKFVGSPMPKRHAEHLKRVAAAGAHGMAHGGTLLSQITDAVHLTHMLKSGSFERQKGDFGLQGEGDLFSEMLTAAGRRERSQVTFNALLGSREKTAALLKEINKYAAETPFLLEDTIDASKRLLAVTGRNVEENVKLTKLGGMLAAMRPGESVAHAAQAMVSGAVGEFESLKTFGIVLYDSQFTGKGLQKGTKEYQDAVVEAVQAQLTAKTGGADLVGALSTTMEGRLSTIKGVYEEIMAEAGSYFVENAGVKDVLAGFGRLVDEIGGAMRDNLTFGGVMSWSGDPIEAWGITIGDTFGDAIRTMTNFGLLARGIGNRILDFITIVDPHVRKMVVQVGLLVASIAGSGGLSAAIGIAGSIFLGFITLLTLPVSLPLLGALAAAASGTLALMFPLGALALLVGSTLAHAFFAFRKEGEDLQDTLARFGMAAGNALLGGLQRLYLLVMGFIDEAWPYFAEGIGYISNAMKAFGTTMKPFIEWLGRAAGTNLSSFSDAGRAAGKAVGMAFWALSVVLEDVGKKIVWLIGHFLPHVKAFTSDVVMFATAMKNILLGTGDWYGSLRVAMAGFADIILVPFRTVLSEIMLGAATVMRKIGEMAAAYKLGWASTITDSAASVENWAETVKEGFLLTNEFMGNTAPMEVAWRMEDLFAQVNVTTNIDGAAVADNQAKLRMRSRNASNPMDPGELGFILENGGRSVRAVNVNDVTLSPDVP